MQRAETNSHILSRLHLQICIEYYAKFLAMEHSSENLDFYESVNYYHHEFDTHKHTAQVKIAPKIFSLYIKLDAPLSVNLPSKIRGKISPFFSDVKKRQNIQKDIFDEASKEIYTVMNRDSFARFRISDLWKEVRFSLTVYVRDDTSTLNATLFSI